MSAAERARAMGVVQAPATLVANRPAGAYRHLSLEVADVAELARPGQFVAVTVGGDLGGTLLRRAFSIHRVRWPIGPGAGTVEVVVGPHGPGTQWLTSRGEGEVVDLVGPLGRPFPLPTEPVPCVLVGGGYGSAPLFWLAQALRARHCPVSMVLGAASKDRLFGVEEAEELATTAVVTTEDGSLGIRGRVTDVLAELIERENIGVAYACGPMGMLKAVTDVAQRAGIVAQVAVEEAMACGVGICMTCVMPVVGKDGVTRMVRSCLEGPTFRGDRVRWDAFGDGWCRVPEDAAGAPRAGGH